MSSTKRTEHDAIDERRRAAQRGRTAGGGHAWDDATPPTNTQGTVRATSSWTRSQPPWRWRSATWRCDAALWHVHATPPRPVRAQTATRTTVRYRAPARWGAPDYTSRWACGYTTTWQPARRARRSYCHRPSNVLAPAPMPAATHGRTTAPWRAWTTQSLLHDDGTCYTQFKGSVIWLLAVNSPSLSLSLTPQ